MLKKSKGYFKVDRGFFELGLRPHTAMVYLYLLSSINKDTRQCWPSMKTIARKLNISKSTVEKAIVELEQRALIIKSNRSRESRIISNLYTLPDGIAYYHREVKDEVMIAKLYWLMIRRLDVMQEWGDEIHQVAVLDAKRTHGEFNSPKE